MSRKTSDSGLLTELTNSLFRCNVFREGRKKGEEKKSAFKGSLTVQHKNALASDRTRTKKKPKTNKDSADENLLNLPFGSKITSGPSKLFLWGLALPFRIPFASVCGSFWSLASAGGLRIVAFHSSSPRRVIART